MKINLFYIFLLITFVIGSAMAQTTGMDMNSGESSESSTESAETTESTTETT